MQQTNIDEIDLKELSVSIYLYFKRHAKLVGSFILLGILFALMAFWLIPRPFPSKMVIQSDILTESITDRIAETLNELIDENNVSELGTRLSLTQLEASAITQITIESIRGVVDANQKENEKIIFLVTVRVLDVTLIPKLQAGLISYLSNNEYVKVRVQQRVSYYRQLIAKIESELASLDSLKSRLLESNSVRTSSEFMIMDPSKLYSESVALKEKQMGYQNALEISSSVQIIQGFVTHTKPGGLGWWLYIIIGGLAGLLGSQTFIIVRWVRKEAGNSSMPIRNGGS